MQRAMPAKTHLAEINGILCVSEMDVTKFGHFHSTFNVIFHLTRLLKASLDPLREPAQVTVTVQGVRTEGPAETRSLKVQSSAYKKLRHTKSYTVWCLQVGQRGEVVECSFWYG